MLQFSAFDFYVLRRPAKPIEPLLSLNESIRTNGFTALEEGLRNVSLTHEFVEAISLASPSLLIDMTKWQEGKSLSPKKWRRLMLSLYKYFIRMSTRCTPYGLFAGYTMGRIEGSNTEVSFSEITDRHVQLDANYLTEIVACLLRDSIVCRQVKFRKNSSLYMVGNSYRYVRYTLSNSGKRSYQLASINKNFYISKILNLADRGVYLHKIEEMLVKEERFSESEAVAFVEQMIKTQLLVSSLDIEITGGNLLSSLIKKLEHIHGVEPYISTLQTIGLLLEQDISIVNMSDSIEMITKKNFPSIKSKNILHTDLYFDTGKNIISKKVISDLTRKFETLSSIRRHTKAGTRLTTFRKNFFKKYEGQEVALLEALDSGIGIGYDLNIDSTSNRMPLLDSLTVPSGSSVLSIPWDKLTKLKYMKLQEAKTDKKQLIQLSEEELHELSADEVVPLNTSDSLHALGTFLSESSTHIDSGHYKFFLQGIVGPSAANLLGRFCRDNNDSLTHQLLKCIKEEEGTRPNAIFAEVVHLPESRDGNILKRPTLRKYEIPYLGKSSVPINYQIPLDDLVVSVKQERLYLRSKKFDQEVIPRLASAHNYNKGLPVYKFLCDMQSQDSLTAYWDWGYPFDQEDFLPRIEYKNVVLTRARWYLKKDNFTKKLKSDDNLNELFQEIRDKYNIPRYVLLASGDNELLLDLDGLPSLEILKSRLIHYNVKLFEFISHTRCCFLKDAHGSYTNEVIIPLKKHSKNKENAASESRLPVSHSITTKRSFPINSEWLYAKIYVSNQFADLILTEAIKPLTDRLLKEGIIEQWFFIRYYDPDGHIRIRFNHSNRKTFWQEVLGELSQTLQAYCAEDIVKNIQIDTYKREIERYGNLTMEASEQIFFHDSTSVVRFLDFLEGNEGEKYRWLFAIRGVDMLLNDFSYELKRKHRFIQQLRDNFFREHHGNSKLEHELNSKFRLNRTEINNILNPECDTESIRGAVKCFEDRTYRNKVVVHRIQKLCGDTTKSSLSLDVLLSSYLHMFLNRMFIGKQRLHELVIHHHLSKYYASEVAKAQSSLLV